MKMVCIAYILIARLYTLWLLPGSMVPFSFLLGLLGHHTTAFFLTYFLFILLFTLTFICDEICSPELFVWTIGIYYFSNIGHGNLLSSALFALF